MNRATHDVFDLFVRVSNELRSMNNLPSYHPADGNAFMFGVLSGLNFGKARLGASLAPASGRLVDILSNTAEDLSKLLYEANGYMPSGSFFTAQMLVHPAYRTGTSKEYYGKGIRLGFTSAIQIFEAISICEFDKMAQGPALLYIESLYQFFSKPNNI